MSVAGYQATDTVCVTSSALTCMVNFKWFAVTSQTGMDAIDGIVGMATGFDSNSGPLLITTLFNQNLISAPVFGFSLSSNPKESYLDIGILMPDAVNSNSKTGIVWLPTTNNS